MDLSNKKFGSQTLITSPPIRRHLTTDHCVVLPHISMSQVPLDTQDVALGPQHVPRRAPEDTVHEETSVLSKVHAHFVIIGQEKQRGCGFLIAEQRLRSSLLLTTSKVVVFFLAQIL